MMNKYLESEILDTKIGIDNIKKLKKDLEKIEIPDDLEQEIIDEFYKFTNLLDTIIHEEEEYITSL